MTQLDTQTKTWLLSLKLNKKLTKIEDFANGYYFGLILETLQLSKGKKFSNNSDLGCIFQNYKNVRDLLLENFNYDFPVNNIIYRGQQLLKTIRQQCQNYLHQKKTNMLKAAASITPNPTIIPPSQLQQPQQKLKIQAQQQTTSPNIKLPKKIQDIELKLQKFRQQKNKHQLFALQTQKLQQQQYRSYIQQNRNYQLTKLQKTHQQIQSLQSKVKTICQNTNLIKNQRIQTTKALSLFHQQKQIKYLQKLKLQQQNTITQGLQMFQLNCMRQGIQLQHDPDKLTKQEQYFNKVVVMEKINDNILKNQKDKKQRCKRENQKKIDAFDAKNKSEQIWKQINKIDHYRQKIELHYKICEQKYQTEQRIIAEQQTRKQKCQQKKYIQLLPFGNQQQRQQQFRTKKLQYLLQNTKRMEHKYKKRTAIAQQIVQTLLHITISTQHIYQQNGGFTYSQWKTLETQFLNFEDQPKDKTKNTKLSTFDFSPFNQQLRQYLKSQSHWQNFNSQPPTHPTPPNNLLISTISTIINKVHPNKQLPIIQKPPLYMPLKLYLHGPHLSGKTTLSSKLTQKYNLLMISPLEIIKQAIELAKPPTQQQPKKIKKDKKYEQPTPQKIILKEFGMRLLETITSHKQAQIIHIIQAIKLRIQQHFKNKNQQQQIQQYVQAKQKQKVRYQQVLKQFQDGQKKITKKDNKKNVQPIIEQPPKSNQCFYSTGFIIDDLPLTPSTLKSLQRELNAYLSYNQQINPQGTKTRQTISNILPIPQPPHDPSLKSGFLDLLFTLTAPKDQLLKRSPNRKQDPLTKTIYHPLYNPIPNIKGFAEKLVDLRQIQQPQLMESVEKYYKEKIEIWEFYGQFGMKSNQLSAYQEIDEAKENIQGTFRQLNKIITTLLKEKYRIIEEKISNNKNKISSNQPNSNQEKQTNNTKQTDTNKQNEQQLQKQPQPNQPTPTLQQLLPPSTLINQHLTKQNCQFLLTNYITVITNYQQGIKQSLSKLATQRQNFTKQLLNIQKNFITLINRPDDKVGKILEFQQNYNKLLSQQSNIVRAIQASNHLIQKLNQLYDSLWDSIGNKMNQSVQEREVFRNSNWLNTQTQKLVEIGKDFIQVELNYICETIFVIIALSCQLQHKDANYENQYLLLGIAPQLQPIPSITPNDLSTNPRFSYYRQQTDKCLSILDTWIEQKYRKMKIQRSKQIDLLINEFVQYTVKHLQEKLVNLGNKINERILEQRSYYQCLINKMDDWIIHGIKSQNNFIYSIYNSIKTCISYPKRSTIKQLHVKQITQSFIPIQQLTLYPIPLRQMTKNKNIPIYSYMIFFEQVKTITNTEGKIYFEIFKKYMDKRKKSELLHPMILKIDYDKMQQYLVKENYLFLRQLALAVILWDVNVFDDEQLSQYKAKLLKTQPSADQLQFKIKSNTSQIKNQSILSQVPQQQQKNILQQLPHENQQLPNKQPQNSQPEPNNSSLFIKKQTIISTFPTDKKLTLDELILMEGAFDRQQQYIVKHLIFEIYRENGTDYLNAQSLLDTLSIFDQLQVLRYGDTIMMLNI